MGGGRHGGANGPAMISTVMAQNGNMNVYVEALGTVTPVYTVSVEALVAGQITNLSYREGQHVHTGDPLVHIDPRPYQAAATEAQDTNLRILRAQLEHAIAVLLGKPPASFSIPRSPLMATPPAIPVDVPSQLLQRRPDIAAAERAVYAANVEIGVARSAFFPAVTLSAAGGFEGSTLARLPNWSSRVWSLGASAGQTVFNAGLLPAVAKYRAAYESSVAQYRQTVLSAFQSVEDNLVELCVLKTEIQQQQVAVNYSQKSLDLALYQYKLGINSYLEVITAQTTLLTNRQTLVTLYTQQMMDAVQLVEDLGGGWDASQLPKA